MINPTQDFFVINSMQTDSDEFPLAMAYIRRQQVLDTYPTAEGFSYGTIFRELNKPFGEMRK